jgi:hypothetical protein
VISDVLSFPEGAADQHWRVEGPRAWILFVDLLNARRQWLNAQSLFEQVGLFQQSHNLFKQSQPENPH